MRLCVTFFLLAILLVGCAAAPGGLLPGDAAPVVKLGLIAPFEGLGRPLGYSVLPAVQAAVAEANAGTALGRYRVALVAWNDDMDGRSAAAQARALALDGDLLAVLGPWTDAAAGGAIPVLAQAGVPELVIPSASELPPGILSACPTPDAIAAALVARAADGGAASPRIAGPDNPLAQALLGRLPVTDRQLLPEDAAPIADQPVIFTGDAAAAADAVLRWRAGGWNGPLLGGPELARPWFIQLASGAAPGAQAVACRLAGGAEGGGTGSQPEAQLARAATRILLDVLARDITAHGQPTRAGMLHELSEVTLDRGVVWLVVRDGEWVAATPQ